MGHIASKFALKLAVAFLILVGFGYASIQYFEKSKGKRLSTNVQENKAPIVPAEEKPEEGSKTTPHEETNQKKDAPWLATASKALADPSVSARIRAIEGLRKHPTPEAVNLLCAFINDNNGTVVSEAIDTLGYIGLNSDLGEVVYGILEEKAGDESFALRGQALLTASMIGKEQILPTVSEFMSEKTDSAQDFAVRALCLIASPACVSYLDILLRESQEPGVRRNCFNILANINTPEALSILQNYGRSSNNRDQAASVVALSRLNRPEINEMLADEMRKQQLERETIEALAGSPGAPDIFGSVLQDEAVEKEQKISWLQALAKYAVSYGPIERRTRLKEAVEPLLYDPDPEVQAEAIKTISGVGPPDVYPTLSPMLEPSKDPEVREQTMYSLVGYITPKNYTELFPLLWDDDQEIRRTALMCVQQFVSKEDLKEEDFVKAKDHPDELISKHVTMLIDQLNRIPK